MKIKNTIKERLEKQQLQLEAMNREWDGIGKLEATFENKVRLLTLLKLIPTIESETKFLKSLLKLTRPTVLKNRVAK